MNKRKHAMIICAKKDWGQIMTQTKIHEYTTFPRQFSSYRWFKPILVCILLLLFDILASTIILILGMLIGVYEGIPTSTLLQSQTYDTMDVYSITGCIVSLGSVAVLWLCLFLANKIVKDRPFSSFSSSRGGWDWNVFFRCLLIALPVIAIPNLIWLFTAGPITSIRFTVFGFFACIILGCLQCIAEEYVFRGFCLQTLASWIRIPILAILIQTAIFASLHPYDIVGVIEIFISGLIMGLIAWYTRGLEASSAMHIINNLTIFLATGFGIGKMATETNPIGTVITVLAYSTYFAILVYLDYKKPIFNHVLKDDVALYNEKLAAK